MESIKERNIKKKKERKKERIKEGKGKEGIYNSTGRSSKKEGYKGEQVSKLVYFHFKLQPKKRFRIMKVGLVVQLVITFPLVGVLTYLDYLGALKPFTMISRIFAFESVGSKVLQLK